MLRPTLQTARLGLRPVADSDRAAFLETLNDFEVTRWLRNVPYPYSDADFDYFLTEIAVPGRDFVIEDAMGFAGVIGFDEGPDFGYWLAPRAQGKGYATEAGRAVVELALANGGEVRSGYFLGNHRSARVLQKLGFVDAGQEDQFCVAQGMVLPHVWVVLRP